MFTCINLIIIALLHIRWHGLVSHPQPRLNRLNYTLRANLLITQISVILQETNKILTMLCITQYCKSVFAKKHGNYADIEIAETHERMLGLDYGKVYTDAVK